mgnify:CR=1 FL=1
MNPKFPSLSSKEVIRLLREHGFEEDRQKGSHLVFYHPKDGRRAVVPAGKKNVPIGTLKSILKEAGVDLDYQ